MRVSCVPAQTMVEASGCNDCPEKAAKHVSSATGGTLTYRKVEAKDPPDEVVPQPEVMVSAQPT